MTCQLQQFNSQSTTPSHYEQILKEIAGKNSRRSLLGLISKKTPAICPSVFERDKHDLQTIIQKEAYAQGYETLPFKDIKDLTSDSDIIAGNFNSADITTVLWPGTIYISTQNIELPPFALQMDYKSARASIVLSDLQRYDQKLSKPGRAIALAAGLPEQVRITYRSAFPSTVPSEFDFLKELSPHAKYEQVEIQ